MGLLKNTATELSGMFCRKASRRLLWNSLERVLFSESCEKESPNLKEKVRTNIYFIDTCIIQDFRSCYYTNILPFSLAFFNTADNPFLLMVRRAVVDTFNVIHLSSSGI